MLTFAFGVIIGAAAVLAAPPDRVDWLRQSIRNKWQKITKKG